MKTCRDCQSPDLVPRGKYFRNQCHACWARTQRERWAAKREQCREDSRAMYQKHSEAKRADSAARRKENPEYYALAEWFRKKGIPISSVPTSDVKALIEMKKAVKAAKTISNQQKQ